MNSGRKEKKKLFNQDRRKLRRFAEQLAVQLLVCNVRHKPRKIEKYNGRTLDVSLGGLRIESETPLPTDTVIGFELDASYGEHGLYGVGKVKWCEPRPDSAIYEFGIAFPDDFSTIRNIKEYLCWR